MIQEEVIMGFLVSDASEGSEATEGTEATEGQEKVKDGGSDGSEGSEGKEQFDSLSYSPIFSFSPLTQVGDLFLF
jgi:hypothetical protein